MHRIQSTAAGSRTGRSLRARWGILTAIGLGVGAPIGIFLLPTAEVVVGMFLVLPLVFAVSGAILGTTQWFAVRYLARAGWWIALSAAGLAIGLSLGTVAVEVVGGWLVGGPVRFRTASAPAVVVSFVGMGGIAGLTLGAAQWVCLRRRFAGGRRWVVANGAALAFGMPCGFLVAELLVGDARSALGLFTLFVVAAIACGLVTGRVLAAQARAAARAFRLSRTG